MLRGDGADLGVEDDVAHEDCKAEVEAEPGREGHTKHGGHVQPEEHGRSGGQHPCRRLHAFTANSITATVVLCVVTYQVQKHHMYMRRCADDDDAADEDDGDEDGDDDDDDDDDDDGDDDDDDDDDDDGGGGGGGGGSVRRKRAPHRPSRGRTSAWIPEPPERSRQSIRWSLPGR